MNIPQALIDHAQALAAVISRAKSKRAPTRDNKAVIDKYVYQEQRESESEKSKLPPLLVEYGEIIESIRWKTFQNKKFNKRESEILVEFQKRDKELGDEEWRDTQKEVCEYIGCSEKWFCENKKRPDFPRHTSKGWPAKAIRRLHQKNLEPSLHEIMDEKVTISGDWDATRNLKAMHDEVERLWGKFRIAQDRGDALEMERYLRAEIRNLSRSCVEQTNLIERHQLDQGELVRLEDRQATEKKLARCIGLAWNAACDELGVLHERYAADDCRKFAHVVEPVLRDQLLHTLAETAAAGHLGDDEVLRCWSIDPAPPKKRSSAKKKAPASRKRARKTPAKKTGLRKQ